MRKKKKRKKKVWGGTGFVVCRDHHRRRVLLWDEIHLSTNRELILLSHKRMIESGRYQDRVLGNDKLTIFTNHKRKIEGNSRPGLRSMNVHTIQP